MLRKPVLGVGWDVGGWLGQKQAVAVVTWENDSGCARWLGSARCFSIGSWHRGDWQIDDLVRLAWADAPADALVGFDVNVAIDAPLGFPLGFMNLLAGGPTISFDPRRPEIENPLAYRETDRHIFDVFGKKPLSASFDKLGNNATVAMVHTNRLRKQGRLCVLPFDDKLEGVPTAIEVYPALLKTAKVAGMPAPAASTEAVRRLLPAGAADGTDECDACICALMALASGLGGRFAGMPLMQSPPTLTSEITREGWIYYPSAEWAPRRSTASRFRD